MNRKILIGVVTVALGVLALAGCAQGGSGSGSTGESDEYSSEAPTPTKDVAAASLATAQNPLGTIVVDGKGMTVYVFDKDTADSGASTCEGDCLAKWPAVVATSEKPEATGVTGTVGEITRTDGTKQVTLNGLPLYYFAGDAAAGDTTGQGLGGVWWVVAPTGDKIGG